MLETFSAVDDAIDANANLADAIYETGVQSFRLHDPSGGIGLENGDDSQASPEEEASTSQGHSSKRRKKPHSGGSNSTVPATDLDKARNTLRQLYRDWAAEGATERAACYGPVLNALETEFATVPAAERGAIRVLVPGAGLGRLVFDICVAGFAVEGNEISYHQLLTSSFILNHTSQGQQHPLYPWALGFANHLTRANQLQKVMVPDVHPCSVLQAASEGKAVHAYDRLSMTAADFCVLYKDDEHRDAYDAVATVFFIDTTPNLIAYIETIRNCLREGGIWINLGPLLWHFEANEARHDSRVKGKKSWEEDMKTGRDSNWGIAEPGSVELTDEETVELVRRFGFQIEKNDVANSVTGYIQDRQSMLMNVYRPSFWIARKT